MNYTAFRDAKVQRLFIYIRVISAAPFTGCIAYLGIEQRTHY